MGSSWRLRAIARSSCRKRAASREFFSYVAFAPARGIGVCAAINAFNLDAGLAMAKTANDLIMELAPR